MKENEVEAEETVYSGRYSNNGAGPMWCYGNTCIVWLGELRQIRFTAPKASL